MRYRRLPTRYATVVTIRSFTPGAELLRGFPGAIRPVGLGWRPAADVCQSDEAIQVTVELAGVEDEDVEITLFQDALVVEGSRRLGAPAAGVYHAAEIRQGPFRLEVPLPERLDADQVTARFERGLLTIVLPTAVPAEPISLRPTPAEGGEA